MSKFMRLCGMVVLAGLACATSASACGDKFLAPGRGPTLCAINKPPHQIAILIYGNPNTATISKVSSAEYQKSMALVGYKVTTCTGDEECARELKGKKFDVVLADAKDARVAQEKSGAQVVPLLMDASKDEMNAAKNAYGQAFDAARGSLKLLPVINSAANQSVATR